MNLYTNLQVIIGSLTTPKKQFTAHNHLTQLDSD